MLLRNTSLVLSLLAGQVGLAGAEERINYQDHVLPILRQHCFACHTLDDPTSDLALDSFEAVLEGGAGGKVVQPGDVDGSRLWKLITFQEQPNMPPEGTHRPHSF